MQVAPSQPLPHTPHAAWVPHFRAGSSSSSDHSRLCLAKNDLLADFRASSKVKRSPVLHRRRHDLIPTVYVIGVFKSDRLHTFAESRQIQLIDVSGARPLALTFTRFNSFFVRLPSSRASVSHTATLPEWLAAHFVSQRVSFRKSLLALGNIRQVVDTFVAR